MDEINVRQGETLNLGVTSDDTDAATATLYVGNVGETPLITATIELVDGVGGFSLTTEQTNIPVGTYKYQLNILHNDGQLEMYPDPEDCGDDGLPNFIVSESLSEGA